MSTRSMRGLQQAIAGSEVGVGPSNPDKLGVSALARANESDVVNGFQSISPMWEAALQQYHDAGATSPMRLLRGNFEEPMEPQDNMVDAKGSPDSLKSLIGLRNAYYGGR